MDMLSPAQIRELRESLGLTLKEFGRKVGVSESCVHHWESGRTHPTYHKMIDLNKLRDKQNRAGELEPA